MTGNERRLHGKHDTAAGCSQHPVMSGWSSPTWRRLLQPSCVSEVSVRGDHGPDAQSVQSRHSGVPLHQVLHGCSLLLIQCEEVNAGKIGQQVNAVRAPPWQLTRKCYWRCTKTSCAFFKISANLFSFVNFDNVHSQLLVGSSPFIKEIMQPMHYYVLFIRFDRLTIIYQYVLLY